MQELAIYTSIVRNLLDNADRETDKYDLRSTLDAELPRGTLNGFFKIEERDVIIYYSYRTAVIYSDKKLWGIVSFQ